MTPEPFKSECIHSSIFTTRYTALTQSSFATRLQQQQRQGRAGMRCSERQATLLKGVKSVHPIVFHRRHNLIL